MERIENVSVESCVSSRFVQPYRVTYTQVRVRDSVPGALYMHAAEWRGEILGLHKDSQQVVPTSARYKAIYPQHCVFAVSPFSSSTKRARNSSLSGSSDQVCMCTKLEKCCKQFMTVIFSLILCSCVHDQTQGAMGELSSVQQHTSEPQASG